MTVNYTTFLGLAQPVSGTEDGTWGDTVNNNLTAYLDDAIAGAQIISGTLTAVTLSKTTGANLSQAGTGSTGSSQYQIIRCTGAPASLLTITVPAANKTYVVINATSTSQSVKIVGAGPTAGVTITSGKTSIVSWNGSGFVEITPSTISGTLPVANGGTGNTTGTATINANLTGAITSIGNAASLGSFTSANLAAALTDETGTGANVFANAPTFPAQINLTANSGYNIYASGTADNYLAGRISVGGTNFGGDYGDISNQRTLTGAANTAAFGAITTVASDVTTIYSSFKSQPATQAASFTLGTLAHFSAQQYTKGAGSTITYQYGYLVDTSLTNGVNNYGFYGGIASGTGRYNLYMGGTADNYLAGSLGIGTSLASSKLHVRSDVNALTILGQFQNRVSGANTGSVLAFITSANDTADNRYSYIGAVTTGVGQNGNNLVFASNANGQAAVERMRIESSGNIGIGTASPNASAILDVQSTTKGVRMPNMTTTQKNAISSPAAGLMVFDTTLSKLCVYSGSAWQTITSI